MRDQISSSMNISELLLKISNKETIHAQSLERVGLADKVYIKNPQVRLLESDEKKKIKLSGVVEYCDDNILRCGGTINEILPVDSHNLDTIVLKCKLTDTFLSINKNKPLNKGTIWFTLNTKQVLEKISISDTFEEDFKPFFKQSDPLNLGPVSIGSIDEEEPYSIAAQICISSPEKGLTSLIVLPARLYTKTLGENTILFIHGDDYDRPFVIPTNKSWRTSVSSNIFLQLMSPNCKSGLPLVQGTAALSGNLVGHGLTAKKLKLTSELTRAEAFPESNWPQAIPDQQISLTIFEDGSTNFDITLNPLSFESFQIHSENRDNDSIPATLSDNGLLLNNEQCLLSFIGLNHSQLHVSTFVIDGNGYFETEVTEKKLSFDNILEADGLLSIGNQKSKGLYMKINGSIKAHQFPEIKGKFLMTYDYNQSALSVCNEKPLADWQTFPDTEWAELQIMCPTLHFEKENSDILYTFEFEKLIIQTKEKTSDGKPRIIKEISRSKIVVTHDKLLDLNLPRFPGKPDFPLIKSSFLNSLFK